MSTQIEPLNTKHTVSMLLWDTMRDEVSKHKPEAYLWDLAHDGVQLAQARLIGIPMYRGVKRNGCGPHLFTVDSFTLEEFSKEVWHVYRITIERHNLAGYPEGKIEKLTDDQ